ncbi:uncharacterized protein RAG0_02758 [Rhynchosporium agropyri]|uniref:Uncharacterized protein n=1 Tax=Rhynchosporium agropyri TaxID=914238 RepID=A0A1E1K2R0_9HELO|nr:uncharacterized protein RAG0_02758 [Rhynchosporium agropyri]
MRTSFLAVFSFLSAVDTVPVTSELFVPVEAWQSIPEHRAISQQSQYRSKIASQHHGITASQLHSFTASQHNRTTTPQPRREQRNGLQVLQSRFTGNEHRRVCRGTFGDNMMLDYPWWLDLADAGHNLIFHQHSTTKFNTQCRFEWSQHPNALQLLSIFDTWILQHAITDHTKATFDLLDWEQLRDELDGVIDDGKWRKKKLPLLLTGGYKKGRKLDDVVMDKLKDRVKKRVAKSAVGEKGEERGGKGGKGNKKGEQSKTKTQTTMKSTTTTPTTAMTATKLGSNSRTEGPGRGNSSHVPIENPAATQQAQEQTDEHHQGQGPDQSQNHGMAFTGINKAASFIAPRIMRTMNSVTSNITSVLEGQLDRTKTNLLRFGPQLEPDTEPDVDPDQPLRDPNPNIDIDPQRHLSINLDPQLQSAKDSAPAHQLHNSLVENPTTLSSSRAKPIGGSKRAESYTVAIPKSPTRTVRSPPRVKRNARLPVSPPTHRVHASKASLPVSNLQPRTQLPQKIRLQTSPISTSPRREHPQKIRLPVSTLPPREHPQTRLPPVSRSPPLPRAQLEQSRLPSVSNLSQQGLPTFDDLHRSRTHSSFASPTKATSQLEYPSLGHAQGFTARGNDEHEYQSPSPVKGCTSRGNDDHEYPPSLAQRYASRENDPLDIAKDEERERVLEAQKKDLEMKIERAKRKAIEAQNRRSSKGSSQEEPTSGNVAGNVEAKTPGSVGMKSCSIPTMTSSLSTPQFLTPLNNPLMTPSLSATPNALTPTTPSYRPSRIKSLMSVSTRYPTLSSADHMGYTAPTPPSITSGGFQSHLQPQFQSTQSPSTQSTTTKSKSTESYSTSSTQVQPLTSKQSPSFPYTQSSSTQYKSPSSTQTTQPQPQPRQAPHVQISFPLSSPCQSGFTPVKSPKYPPHATISFGSQSASANHCSPPQQSPSTFTPILTTNTDILAPPPFTYSASAFLSSLQNPDISPVQEAALQLRGTREELARKKRRAGSKVRGEGESDD